MSAAEGVLLTTAPQPADSPRDITQPIDPSVLRALRASEPDGSPSSATAPLVTIILPCYNERDHVLLEIERISAAMDASGYSYELMVIDDASSDDTLAVIRSVEQHYPRLRVMPFHRNGGSGTARRIGTEQARGQIVVWTDADMTYPNERIPEFVGMLESDPTIDQVVGARTREAGT